MDQPAKLKGFFFRHRNAVREVVRHERTRNVLHTLLHIVLLGGLIMLGLLKWMLLPPFPQGTRGMLPPADVLMPVTRSASLPAESQILKIKPEKNPFKEVASASTAASKTSMSSARLWTKDTSPQYWTWLKPVLISAEVVPLLFFLWNGLRAYQITHRQRDWVMSLMGAHPSDIHRLLHYRSVLLTLGASGVGVGSFTLLALCRKEVPLLPDILGWWVLGLMLVLGFMLSFLAYRFPPDEVTDPML